MSTDIKQCRIKFGSLKRYAPVLGNCGISKLNKTSLLWFLLLFSFFLTFLLFYHEKTTHVFFVFFQQFVTGIPPRRIRKEIASYQKEADAQQAKITELEAQGADTADVNKQKEVLNETVAMIPECEARLKDAQADVEAILAGASDELKGQEMYNEALGVIQELGGTIAEAEEEDL